MQARRAGSPATDPQEPGHVLGKITEQKLSQARLLESLGAAKVGELLGVQLLITGKWMKLGNHGEIVVRLIDTTQGRIVGSHTQIVRKPLQAGRWYTLLVEND